jgi:hypothetical protein
MTCSGGTSSPAAKRRDVELAVGGRTDAIAEMLGAAKSVSSDFGKLEANRHLTDGIACATAGFGSEVAPSAAPEASPACLMNVRRSMMIP